MHFKFSPVVLWWSESSQILAFLKKKHWATISGLKKFWQLSDGSKRNSM